MFHHGPQNFCIWMSLEGGTIGPEDAVEVGERHLAHHFESFYAAACLQTRFGGQASLHRNKRCV